MINRTIFWSALLGIVGLFHGIGGALASTPFATVPGNPVGVICAQDGEAKDQLLVTSFNPGNLHVVRCADSNCETNTVETKCIPPFPCDWTNVESHLRVSSALGDWSAGDIYATHGPTVFKLVPISSCKKPMFFIFNYFYPSIPKRRIS